MPDPHCTELSDPISTGNSDSEEDNSIMEGGFQQHNRLWITKWVDYSNKYGFGGQLSNGCIVVRYNDGTTLAVDTQKRYLFSQNRSFRKLRHENRFPLFYEIVKVIEFQWDLTSIFNSVRVMQSFQKSFGNQIIMTIKSKLLSVRVCLYLVMLYLHYVLFFLLRRLQYFDEDRNIFRFSASNIPDDLNRKVTLLNYFSNYMERHLLKVWLYT